MQEKLKDTNEVIRSSWSQDNAIAKTKGTKGQSL